MRWRALLLCTVFVLAGFAARETKTTESVARATLPNGLRVVIVRDPLAPVVTLEQNYVVGADETPAGFPGMAHAQEHMAFRGCAGVSADQIAAIYAGGSGQSEAVLRTHQEVNASGATGDLSVPREAGEFHVRKQPAV